MAVFTLARVPGWGSTALMPSVVVWMRQVLGSPDTSMRRVARSSPDRPCACWRAMATAFVAGAFSISACATLISKLTFTPGSPVCWSLSSEQEPMDRHAMPASIAVKHLRIMFVLFIFYLNLVKNKSLSLFDLSDLDRFVRFICLKGSSIRPSVGYSVTSS